MYAIGDQVEDYVLTERGWVPRLDLDTSPHRPGHVVNGSILTGDLEWRPLRTAPVAPYQVGDVVEDYVLVPSGDWRPLADQMRDTSGATVARQAAPAQPRQSEPVPTQRTARPTTQRPTQRQPAQRTATTATAQPATARPATARPVAAQRTAAPSTLQSRPQPAQAPAYRIGQVVSGHILTPDRGWVPLPGSTPAGPRPQTREQQQEQAKKSSAGCAVTSLIIGLIVLSSFTKGCG